MIALLHPGDLGLEGLVMAAVWLLICGAIILIPLILLLNWLAGKSGALIKKRKAEKDISEHNVQ